MDSSKVVTPADADIAAKKQRFKWTDSRFEVLAKLVEEFILRKDVRQGSFGDSWELITRAIVTDPRFGAKSSLIDGKEVTIPAPLKQKSVYDVSTTDNITTYI
jgi:hypothetical protein